jgi:hypothetical protein
MMSIRITYIGVPQDYILAGATVEGTGLVRQARLSPEGAPSTNKSTTYPSCDYSISTERMIWPIFIGRVPAETRCEVEKGNMRLIFILVLDLVKRWQWERRERRSGFRAVLP